MKIQDNLLKASLDLNLSGNLLEDAGVDLNVYADDCIKYDDLRYVCVFIL